VIAQMHNLMTGDRDGWPVGEGVARQPEISVLQF